LCADSEGIIYFIEGIVEYIEEEGASCMANMGIRNIKNIVGIYWCRWGFMPG